MNYLFYLGHPAHFHNFKNCAKNLINKGHKVLFAVREKDVLLNLVKKSDFEYAIVSSNTRKNTKPGLVWFLLKREWKMLKLSLSFKPDLLIGTDIVITHIGKLLNIPSIVVNEDDDDIVPLISSLGYKFADAILAPNVCRVAKYKTKKIGYEGYHELAYLHPKYFTPNAKNIASKIDCSKPFFILRFAELNAHHDTDKKGITNSLALDIISILEPHGNVYITSERPLSNYLEKYRIQIDPSYIHDALALASLYIGDSQTMAAEAAVLGTYAVRFNDFATQISYLNELEEYGLTKAFNTKQKGELISYIKKLVANPAYKTEINVKKELMLKDKIDVTYFWTDLFTNFKNNN